MVRKALGPKANVPDKRKRAIIAKRRYKVRVITQPTPSHPNLNCTHPMVATVSTQTTTVRSTAESIPVIVYKLAMEQFTEVPCPTTRPQNEKSNPPPLEDIPKVPPDRASPGPIQDQPQKIYLRQEKTGQFPLLQLPCLFPSSKQKSLPKLQQSPMPW